MDLILSNLVKNIDEWNEFKKKQLKHIKGLETLFYYLSDKIKSNFKDLSTTDLMNMRNVWNNYFDEFDAEHGYKKQIFKIYLIVNFELKEYILDFSKKDVKIKLFELYGDLNFAIATKKMLIKNYDLFIDKINNFRIEFILKAVKENPKLYTKYINELLDYANRNTKGKNKYDYISRDILNNQVSYGAIKETVSRTLRKKKKK
jgi:hypothetical protein